ncbi:MAG: dockerin type I domain-containing protein [Pseudomonadota bacterium]
MSDQAPRVRARTIKTMAVLAICTLAIETHAEITSGVVTGGSSFVNGGLFIEIPAPVVLPNNAYNDDNVRAFNEQQDVTLTSNISLHVAASGLDSSILGPGSVVSSHYIIYDPSATEEVEASVTFDEPILGVMIYNEGFNITDPVLGNPGTAYDIGSQELESPDTVTISGDTVSFFLRTVSPGDAIRVITGVDPEPGTTVCVGGTATLAGVVTGGSAAEAGGVFRQICDPIGPVGADNFNSFDLFAFEEQQAVELTAPLAVDENFSIDAGEIVSSFYVVFDPVVDTRNQGTITFPDDIIAVIKDRTQLQDSEFLGNASATYLEPDLLGLEGSDNFTINGNELFVSFRASSPGDSVRVLLGSASPSLFFTVCPPEDVTITGVVLGGTAANNGGVFAQLCDPIGPVGNNNFQSNDLFAYEELQGVVLTDDLTLDENTVVPAGSTVNSYYVSFDPASSRSIQGDVTFSAPILGVATSLETLNDSDFLGNPTANYLNPSLRGLEVDDSVSFAGNVFSVAFSANSPGDYVRVITGTVVDSDGDGVSDDADNCTVVSNASQLDVDGDGYGNACDPDLNNDGVVNFLDIGVFSAAFGSTGSQIADFNGDGVVNFIDYAIVPDYFFGPPGPSGVAP